MDKKNNVQILEATLREGGLGLEDSYKGGYATDVLSQDFINGVRKSLIHSGVDIIELGSIHPSTEDDRRFAIYHNVEEISETLCGERKPNQLYVGMYKGPDTDVNLIPSWNPSFIDGVRVILRYSELQKSLDYCAALADKGYKVFVQPMLTLRYTEAELNNVIDTANRIKAYALYFVDSYGYMQPKDVEHFFDYYDNRLDKEVRIGFHAHNNMNLAYSNVMHFLNIPSDRLCIIDTTAQGIGQGAGNLQSELIIPYLNNVYGKDYNFDYILDVCELLDKEFGEQSLWGYSTTRMLPALYKTAYKFALCLRKKYHLSYREIKHILENMPDDMRHRFTPQDAAKLIEMFK